MLFAQLVESVLEEADVRLVIEELSRLIPR
jgi:hypothetical protein